MDGTMVSSSSETPHERTLFGSGSFKLDCRSNNGEETTDQLFGSGSFKHDRSSNGEETEDEGHQWRFNKLSRTDSLGSNSVYSNGEGQMLSFSSANTHGGSLHSYNYAPSNHHHYFRNEGGMSANIQERVRGPFTPSQWMELEHQALIYKYLASNAPIPPSLLLPLRRSLLSSPFPSPFSPNYFSGWGGQMGYSLSLTSGAGDAEPGRCRRTDGKKWRCSRDAVPDQKYCERHINRGRHRSRKHVEPQKPAIKSAPATSAPPPDVTADVAAAARSAAVHHHKSTTDLWSVSGEETESLSLLTPMLPFSTSSKSQTNNNNNNNNPFESYQRYQSWPELQDERTQLSISIPSMGGPLGEVLTKNQNSVLTNKDLSSKGGLNLLTGLGWDLDSDPQPESSPTGVLQKTGFGSLSSSAGSSPRLESYKAHDDLGSILVNHLSNLSSV
ncbi:hypothetical protein LUZ60_006183 [Juncus effusus]|nr:hypothetical protein LUZ60_006183 [Juncus effusus]